MLRRNSCFRNGNSSPERKSLPSCGSGSVERKTQNQKSTSIIYWIGRIKPLVLCRWPALQGSLARQPHIWSFKVSLTEREFVPPNIWEKKKATLISSGIICLSGRLYTT